MPIQQPIGAKIDQPIRANNKAADPLNQEGRNLEFNRNDRKTTRPLRMGQNPAGHKVTLARAEETKKKRNK